MNGKTAEKNVLGLILKTSPRQSVISGVTSLFASLIHLFITRALIAIIEPTGGG